MLATRKSKRKPTGGLRHTLKRRDKVLSQLANKPTLTTVNPEKELRKVYRGKGGNKKVRALEVKFVNVLMDGKTVKAEVKTVKSNKANREYSRRNIITKGAEIVVTVKNKDYLAKVSSRPGQHGLINAILLSNEEIKDAKSKKSKKSKSAPKKEAKSDGKTSKKTSKEFKSKKPSKKWFLV